MSSLIDSISSTVSKSLGRHITLKGVGRGFNENGPSGVVFIDESTQTKYYVKSNQASKYNELKAELNGLNTIQDTKTVRVARPIGLGKHDNMAYLVSEHLDFYLELYDGDLSFEFGVQLAKMHRCLSPTGKFGFDMVNHVEDIAQPNEWRSDWAEFWDEHRLCYMLNMTDNIGLKPDEVEALRVKTKALLLHKPAPSLLHGELWAGNAAFAAIGQGNIFPIVYDPATYYGDRETDVAMTFAFGGFGADFYNGYESEWPLPDGHKNRATVYNLYHVLNHEVMWGGFKEQAKKMVKQIMAM